MPRELDRQRLGSALLRPLAASACCLVLWGGTGAGLALAARRIPAVFVGLRTLGLDAESTGVLSRALAERLSDDDRFDVALEPKPGLTERCKGDLRCYCEAIRARPSARIIFGNVGRIEAIYSFELVLVDTQDCSVESSVFVTEEHDPTSATRRLAQLTDSLLRPPESVSATAVKAERDVDTVPAVVTVFSDKRAQQLGIDRLEELFRLVPGFEIWDTNWGDVVLHHGLTSTVLYMVDGVPLSNPKFNFSALGSDFRLGLNHVDRVEFVRGPGSVLWGQNAFLGIVNLITRSPSSKDEALRAHVRLGTNNAQEFHASVGATRRWLSYYLSTTFSRSAGPQTRVDNSLFASDLADGIDGPIWGNGGTTDNEADTFADVVAKVLLARRLEIVFHYISQLTYFEISPFGSLLPPADRGFWDTTDFIYAASWSDRLPRGFGYRLSLSRYEHRSWENFVVFPRLPGRVPTGFSSLQGNQLRPEINHLAEARLHHRLQGRWLTNQALVGVAFLHQQMPEQFATLTTGQQQGREELDIAANHFVTLSAYAQDDLSLVSDRLVLSGGLRYDHHDPFRSALSAQGAVIGGVDRLRAKLVYAEGFRPPSMNSLYSTKGTRGNQDLKPERSQAVSLEFTGHPWSPLTVKLGGTWARLTDLIRLEEITDQALKDQGFAVWPVNRDKLNVYSAYAEVLGSWPLFSGFATYTFKHLDAQQPFAAHTASAGFSLRPINDFNTFATASLVSPMDVQVTVPLDSVITQTIDPQLHLDVGITVSNLARMFDLTIKIRNPTRYSYRSPYRFDGRPTPLLERRRVTEVLFTLGWASRIPWK